MNVEMNPTVPTAQRSAGLAIAALVVSVVGLCLFPLAFAAIVMGIIAIVRASKSPERYGGTWQAITAMVLGAIGLLVVPVLSLGLLLPALGRARQAAQQVKSGIQLRAIGTALQQYATDYGAYPEAGADIETRLVDLNITVPEMFESPFVDSGSGVHSYFYRPNVPAGDPATTVIMMENPRTTRRAVNVLFLDGHVELISEADLPRVLAGIRGWHTLTGEPVEPATRIGGE